MSPKSPFLKCDWLASRKRFAPVLYLILQAIFLLLLHFTSDVFGVNEGIHFNAETILFWIIWGASFSLYFIIVFRNPGYVEIGSIDHRPMNSYQLEASIMNTNAGPPQPLSTQEKQKKKRPTNVSLKKSSSLQTKEPPVLSQLQSRGAGDNNNNTENVQKYYCKTQSPDEPASEIISQHQMLPAQFSQYSAKGSSQMAGIQGGSPPAHTRIHLYQSPALTSFNRNSVYDNKEISNNIKFVEQNQINLQNNHRELEAPAEIQEQMDITNHAMSKNDNLQILSLVSSHLTKKISDENIHQQNVMVAQNECSQNYEQKNQKSEEKQKDYQEQSLNGLEQNEEEKESQMEQEQQHQSERMESYKEDSQSNQSQQICMDDLEDVKSQEGEDEDEEEDNDRIDLKNQVICTKQQEKNNEEFKKKEIELSVNPTGQTCSEQVNEHSETQAITHGKQMRDFSQKNIIPQHSKSSLSLSEKEHKLDKNDQKDKSTYFENCSGSFLPIQNASAHFNDFPNKISNSAGQLPETSSKAILTSSQLIQYNISFGKPQFSKDMQSQGKIQKFNDKFTISNTNVLDFMNYHPEIHQQQLTESQSNIRLRYAASATEIESISDEFSHTKIQANYKINRSRTLPSILEYDDVLMSFSPECTRIKAVAPACVLNTTNQQQKEKQGILLSPTLSAIPASDSAKKNPQFSKLSPGSSTLGVKIHFSRSQFDKVLCEEHLPCFGEEEQNLSCKDRSINITNPNQQAAIAAENSLKSFEFQRNHNAISDFSPDEINCEYLNTPEQEAILCDFSSNQLMALRDNSQNTNYFVSNMKNMSFRTSTPTNPSNNNNNAHLLSRHQGGDNILPSYYLNNEDSQTKMNPQSNQFRHSPSSHSNQTKKSTPYRPRTLFLDNQMNNPISNNSRTVDGIAEDLSGKVVQNITDNTKPKRKTYFSPKNTPPNMQKMNRLHQNQGEAYYDQGFINKENQTSPNNQDKISNFFDKSFRRASSLSDSHEQEISYHSPQQCLSLNQEVCSAPLSYLPGQSRLKSEVQLLSEDCMKEVDPDSQHTKFHHVPLKTAKNQTIFKQISENPNYSKKKHVVQKKCSMEGVQLVKTYSNNTSTHQDCLHTSCTCTSNVLQANSVQLLLRHQSYVTSELNTTPALATNQDTYTCPNNGGRRLISQPSFPISVLGSPSQQPSNNVSGYAGISSFRPNNVIQLSTESLNQSIQTPNLTKIDSKKGKEKTIPNNFFMRQNYAHNPSNTNNTNNHENQHQQHTTLHVIRAISENNYLTPYNPPGIIPPKQNKSLKKNSIQSNNNNCKTDVDYYCRQDKSNDASNTNILPSNLFHHMKENKIIDNITQTNYTMPYFEKRYCQACNIDQPTRSKHCAICKRCISTYDHHCPWIGICISQRNRLHFFFFVCTQNLSSVSVIYKVIVFLVNAANNNNNKDIAEIVMACIGLGFVFYVFLMTIMLVAQHFYYITNNITTWEYYSWNRISYLKDQPRSLGSPFSFGAIKNIQYFLKSTFCKTTYEWQLNKIRLPAESANIA